MFSTDLFEQVKRKCNVTWDDDDTDARLGEIIESAIPTLIHRLGIKDPNFDFSSPSQENQFFLNYCFYEWNHALNEFLDNYADDILTIRQKHEVEAYKESGEVIG